MDAVVRVNAIGVPLGPVSAVGVTSSFVVGVTEEKVAGVEGALGWADGIWLGFGLNQIPAGAKCAWGQILNKEETVLTDEDGGGDGW